MFLVSCELQIGLVKLHKHIARPLLISLQRPRMERRGHVDATNRIRQVHPQEALIGSGYAHGDVGHLLVADPLRKLAAIAAAMDDVAAAHLIAFGADATPEILPADVPAVFIVDLLLLGSRVGGLREIWDGFQFVDFVHRHVDDYLEEESLPGWSLRAKWTCGGCAD